MSKKNKKHLIFLGISLAVLGITYGIYVKSKDFDYDKRTEECIYEPTNSSSIKSQTINTDIFLEDIEQIPLTSTIDTSESGEKIEDSEIHIVMVGDVLLHTPINEGALQEDGTYSYAHLFQNIKDDISEADLAIVNQEVIIGGRELGVSGYPGFNAPYEIADALVDTGFDVVLHATNHALDKGEKGILNCLKNWEEKYPEIEVLGIHKDEKSSKEIAYVDIKDSKIAILNYTYGTNGISVPKGKDYLVDYLVEKRVREDIQEAKKNADFVLVCPHWGTEYAHGISAEQKKWAKIFFEEGVDLVLGTHPHVIEPIEMMQDDMHQMLIYYSLGNYINCTSGSGAGTSDRMVGGMAEIKLGRDDASQQLSIKEYAVKPIITQMAYGKNEITTYFWEDYTPELAAQNEVKQKDSNFSYTYCLDLINDVFGSNWE